MTFNAIALGRAPGREARGPNATPPNPRDVGAGPGHRALVFRGGFREISRPLRRTRLLGPRRPESRLSRGAPAKRRRARGRRRSRRARTRPGKSPRRKSPRAPRPGRNGPGRRFPCGRDRPGAPHPGPPRASQELQRGAREAAVRGLAGACRRLLLPLREPWVEGTGAPRSGLPGRVPGDFQAPPEDAAPRASETRVAALAGRAGEAAPCPDRVSRRSFRARCARCPRRAYATYPLYAYPIPTNTTKKFTTDRYQNASSARHLTRLLQVGAMNQAIGSNQAIGPE